MPIIKKQPKLTRGTVASLTGLSPDTIRFYEQEGLLPAPKRTSSNYRIYDDNALGRLKFIKRAQQLGFTLAEIRELITLRNNPDSSSAEVRTLAQTRLRDIEEKIQALQALQQELQALVQLCPGHGQLTCCPIIEALTEDQP